MRISAQESKLKNSQPIAFNFDCVFQILLDFLNQEKKKLGYHFKTVEDTTAVASAYADNRTLISHNVSDNQTLCNLTHNLSLIGCWQ